MYLQQTILSLSTAGSQYRSQIRQKHSFATLSGTGSLSGLHLPGTPPLNYILSPITSEAEFFKCIFVVLMFCFETLSHYVSVAGLELGILYVDSNS